LKNHSSSPNTARANISAKKRFDSWLVESNFGDENSLQEWVKQKKDAQIAKYAAAWITTLKRKNGSELKVPTLVSYMMSLDPHTPGSRA
jgi:hypothetical protein